ncbi:MAG: pentapeptide repeat-containing protein [Bacteroidetes Order II. Incertae sedis bacterium]|nr:pentapeptide repeat-containing protein [Bacteroidetes Order II. bacterium]
MIISIGQDKKKIGEHGKNVLQGILNNLDDLADFKFGSFLREAYKDIKDKTPEQQAFLWLQSALIEAWIECLEQYHRDYALDVSLYRKEGILDVLQESFEINEEFYQKPDEQPFVKAAQRSFEAWLKREAMAARLKEKYVLQYPTFVAKALYTALQATPSQSAFIDQALNDKFFPYQKRVLRWREQQQTWKQLYETADAFGKEFALKEAYIMPRFVLFAGKQPHEWGSMGEDEMEEAWKNKQGFPDNPRLQQEWRRKRTKQYQFTAPCDNPENHDIHKFLRAFAQGKIRNLNLSKIDKEAQNARLLLLLGHPGQGKSSCCLRFMHDLAQDESTETKPLYFVKLRNLEAQDTFWGSPLHSLKTWFAQKHRLDDADFEFKEHGILILDGFDELYMQQGRGDTDVKSFLDVLSAQLKGEEYRTLRVLLTSRTMYVPLHQLEHLKTDVLVAHLADLSFEEQKNYVATYQNATQKTALPLAEFLNNTDDDDDLYQNVCELLSQPLLLQMVAMSEMAIMTGMNRATLYEELFDKLIQKSIEREQPKIDSKGKSRLGSLTPRKEADQQIARSFLRDMAYFIFLNRHEYIRHTDFDDTEGLLRKSANTFAKAIGRESFKDLEADLRSLFSAFYFVQVPTSDKDKVAEAKEAQYAIEFLHKSLWEYLAAERLFTRMCRILTFKDEEANFYDAKTVLAKLHELLAYKWLSPEIVQYFHDICHRYANNPNHDKDRHKIRQRLTELLPKLIRRDFVSALTDDGLPPIEAALNTFYAVWILGTNLLSEQEKQTWDRVVDAEMETYEKSETAKKERAELNKLRYWDSAKKREVIEKYRAPLYQRIEAKRLEQKLDVLINCQEGERNKVSILLFALRHQHLQFSQQKLGDLDTWQFSFAYQNWKNANWAGANLESANLVSANLYRANLESANLVSANLVSANLVSANLVSANLVSANLDSANLYRANLDRANLDRANLVSANLVSANLDSANLDRANLVSANLVSANLKGADLSFADLRHSTWNRDVQFGEGLWEDEETRGMETAQWEGATFEGQAVQSWAEMKALLVAHGCLKE